MPEKLLKFQNMLFRFMPNTMFKQFGFKKADVISLCGTMTELATVLQEFYDNVE